MKLRNPIIETALTLLLLIAALAAFSYSDWNMKVLNVEVKKPTIKEFITYKEPEKVIPPKVSVVIPKTTKDTTKTIAIEIKSHVMDSSPQRILMIGESMIEGLMFPFMKYAKLNHHTVKAKIWYGSRLLDWGANDTLKRVIDAVNPTYIIVSIGSNELFIRNIDERESYVQNIVKQLGSHKFIWVGPPNPKKDNGINDLIMRNVGEDRFFVSKYMHFERKRDGVHPKAQQCYRWADSIAEWIVTKSRYPILLKRPNLDAKGNVIMPVDTTKKDSVHVLKSDSLNRKISGKRSRKKRVNIVQKETKN